MTILEKNILLSKKESNGDRTLLYPVTKAECVDGLEGYTPTIGENGNWFIGEQDTNVKAQGPVGPQGETGPQGPAYTLTEPDLLYIATQVPAVRYDIPLQMSVTQQRQAMSNMGISYQFNDYTPVLYVGNDTVQSKGVTVTSATGRYMMIGNLVYFTVFFRLDLPGNFSNTTGALQISLPIGVSKAAIPVDVGLHSNNVSNTEAAMIWGGESVVSLMTAGGLNSMLTANSSGSTSVGYISVTGWYEMA